MKKNKSPCDSCGSTDWMVIKMRYNKELKRTVSWCDRCSVVHTTPEDSVSAETKEDRKKYFKTLLQPFRGGELSREFAEAYPKEVKQMASEQEIKNSKYVWKDLPGYDHWRKSL